VAGTTVACQACYAADDALCARAGDAMTVASMVGAPKANVIVFNMVFLVSCYAVRHPFDS
jgi:hypothetical protein